MKPPDIEYHDLVRIDYPPSRWWKLADTNAPVKNWPRQLRSSLSRKWKLKGLRSLNQCKTAVGWANEYSIFFRLTMTVKVDDWKRAERSEARRSKLDVITSERLNFAQVAAS